MKSSENHTFSDDFKGNKSLFAQICLTFEAKFGDNSQRCIAHEGKYLWNI